MLLTKETKLFNKR